MAAFLALLLAGGGAWAQSTATLKGVDLYRSDRVTLEDVRKKTDALLDGYVRLRNDGRRSSLKSAERFKAEIENAVRTLGKFAYLAMTFTEYITSAEHTAYITFDVVDQKDVRTRMPFRPAPEGSPPDPAGLVAAWQQYSALGQSLQSQGLISTDRPDCPGFYCSWGAATPELAALEKRFAAEATARKTALKAVFEEDGSAQNRAAALFVLSYLSDGAQVAALSLQSLADPGVEVRAAGLQILSDLSIYHKSVFLDVRQIIPALDYPTVSDRSKAMGVLVGLADNPAYRTYVTSRSAPYLLRLLKLEEPSSRDLAFTLLGMLSKQSYDRRDYASWEQWIASVEVSSAAAAGPSEPAAGNK